MLFNFLDVEDIFVNKEIVESRFSCDLSKCKGACCTMDSQFGAPTTMEEINKIESILPVVVEYLTPKHRKAIEEIVYLFITKEMLQNVPLKKRILRRKLILENRSAVIFSRSGSAILAAPF